MCSWRLGTKSQYESYIKQWNLFCDQRGFSYYSPTVNDILCFLHELFKRNLGYSTINTVRSSLSSFLEIEGKPVGQHHLVKRYLKGVFELRPSLPKYQFTWDVGVVVKFMAEMDTSTLKSLTFKTATLLAILGGQRAAEILFAMDTRNIVLSDELCIIQIGDLLKNSSPKFHDGEIKYPAYHENQSTCP